MRKMIFAGIAFALTVLTLQASQAQTGNALDRRVDRAERRAERRIDRANYFTNQTWNEMSGWVEQNRADAQWMLQRAGQAVGNANRALQRADNLSGNSNVIVNPQANANVANSTWFGYGEKTPENDRWFYDYYTIVPSYSPSTVSLATVDDVDTIEKDMATDRLSVEGKVAALKRSEVSGEAHLIAKLEQPSQNVQVIDLGLAKNIQNKVNVGAQIKATGWVDYIGDEELLVARKIDIDGDWMPIKRQFSRSIDGKVVSVKQVNVQSQPHYVAVVENASNQRVLVDMGATSFYPTPIEQNATVVVQGMPVQTNDRVMVIAHDVKVAGGKPIVVRK